MRRLVLVLGSLCLFAAGCSTAGAASTGGAASGAAAPSASAQTVSTVAQMICGDEAGTDIKQSIGASTTQPVAPTFVGQVYSCKYVYGEGSMVLSVREYADKAATDAGWTADRASAAQPATDLPAIGQAAFAAADGSVFVRKDTKVLHVDVAGLPAQFGVPSRSKVGIAQIVAVVIMNCWKEG